MTSGRPLVRPEDKTRAREKRRGETRLDGRRVAACARCLSLSQMRRSFNPSKTVALALAAARNAPVPPRRPLVPRALLLPRPPRLASYYSSQASDQEPPACHGRHCAPDFRLQAAVQCPVGWPASCSASRGYQVRVKWRSTFSWSRLGRQLVVVCPRFCWSGCSCFKLESLNSNCEPKCAPLRHSKMLRQ